MKYGPNAPVAQILNRYCRGWEERENFHPSPSEFAANEV